VQFTTTERDDVCFTPATTLVEQMHAREISATEVMTAHLSRISEVNEFVNALVTLLDGDLLLAQAKRADDDLAAGREAGPLHGLPIAHKDVVATKGIRTTFGSRAFADHVPEHDELMVERIRRAGAITIGKTNTPEFAAGANTFNAVFGATRNPYDLAKTPGGSSGGAAASVAAGMLPIADGSDLGGSLRIPAGFCNVVGFRPSLGRVPFWPRPTAWSHIVTEGPIARTVRDAALLLSAIAGPDDRAPTSIDQPGTVFGGALERDFSGTSVAWTEDLGCLPVEHEVRVAVAEGRTVLEAMGCHVDDAYPDMADAEEVFTTLRAAGMATSLGQLVQTRPDLCKQTIIGNVEEGLALTAVDVGQAEVKRTALYHRVREFLNAHEFLVMPTNQVLPFDVDLEYVREIDGVPMDSYIDFFKITYFFSALGLPCISVPCGFSRTGLPVGLQIVGGHHRDLDVLQLAHEFERRCPTWMRQPALANVTR
jgi:amidase